MRVSHRIWLVPLLLIVLSCSGCPSRQEIEATFWLNNGLPAELCEKMPELWKRGFYRKLNTDKYEFISFCDPRARDWIASYKDDVNRILDAYLPKPPEAPK